MPFHLLDIQGSPEVDRLLRKYVDHELDRGARAVEQAIEAVFDAVDFYRQYRSVAVWADETRRDVRTFGGASEADILEQVPKVRGSLITLRTHGRWVIPLRKINAVREGN